ncbi:MAG: ethanolamine ammonia-lyase subunit EutC [Eubacteriales bacterium]|nr:ethanolamine ammonia-lyase subunit EutC [Eubacteriales bacterium]
MNNEEIKKIVEQVAATMDLKLPEKEDEPKKETKMAFSGVRANETPSTVVEAVLQTEKTNTVEDGVLDDIRLVNWRNINLVKNPHNLDEYQKLRSTTDARLAVGRAGLRYKTDPWLRLLADHAGSVDAVLKDPDESIIDKNNFFRIQSECENKDVYLSRPDLGRLLSDETKQQLRDNCIMSPDVQIIASEGLSSTAFNENIDDLMKSLYDGLKVEGLKVGTPIYIKYSRVPTEDQVTEVLKPKVTIILIGERPGMSTFSSLSAYITYAGHVGIEESKRTVISNIFDKGTTPIEAGAHIASLCTQMIQQKASGVDLKMV